MSLSSCPKCWDTPCNCELGFLGSKNHAYEKLEPVAKKLYEALSISRGQWIHSVNKDQCLVALAEYEKLTNQQGVKSEKEGS